MRAPQTARANDHSMQTCARILVRLGHCLPRKRVYGFLSSQHFKSIVLVCLDKGQYRNLHMSSFFSSYGPRLVYKSFTFLLYLSNQRHRRFFVVLISDRITTHDQIRPSSTPYHNLNSRRSLGRQDKHVWKQRDHKTTAV